MTTYLAAAFLFLIVASWLLLRRAGTQQKQAGLPEGRVVYSDTGAWNRVEQPLFSRRHLLAGLSACTAQAGKPDYLVEQDGDLVPVEVKPNRTAPKPYESDVLQLAAYCLLVEETYLSACPLSAVPAQAGAQAGAQPPEHGLIRYRDQTFAVDYTPELRDMLLATLVAVRHDAMAHDVNRSHEQAGRCRACGFRSDCTQCLA